MELPIVHYGNPILRQKGARIPEITAEIRQLIDDMFDTMYAESGIGLAAQQIGQALQLTVIDVREVTDRPSSLEIDGQSADVDDFMPLVLINPKIMPEGNPSTGPEGCLSFPEIYADITRPEFVVVQATNAEGKPVKFKAGGLLSRAIQHEVDHLNGILFIDRMTPGVKEDIRPHIDKLHQTTKEALKD